MEYQLRRFWVALSDFIMPRNCVVCGGEILNNENHICIHCASGFPYTGYWLRSHNPMADKFNELVQRRIAIAGSNMYDEVYIRAAALFFYKSDSGYGNISKSLKYDYNLSAGRFFASILGRKLRTSEYFADVDLIIPVPLHPLRKWSRGYNQAEIIAEEIGGILGVPIDKRILRRSRMTGTQTKLNVNARVRNVAGAFCVRRERLHRAVSRKNPHIDSPNVHHFLLVDDVFTTGATLNACYTALVKGLAAMGGTMSGLRVSVATLGYVGES